MVCLETLKTIHPLSLYPCGDMWDKGVGRQGDREIRGGIGDEASQPWKDKACPAKVPGMHNDFC